MQEDYTANVAGSNVADYNDCLPPALRGGLAAVLPLGAKEETQTALPSLADGGAGGLFTWDCVKPAAAEAVPDAEMATPFCDTGLPYTKALIDWQSFTFPDCVVVADVLELLAPAVVASGLNEEESWAAASWVALDRGLHGYKRSFKRGNITVLHDGSPGMGVHVQMSGEGCRQFEHEQGIRSGEGWVSWFGLAASRGAKWTRLDVAMDDREGLLNLQTIQATIDAGHLTSTWRKTSTVQEKRLGRLREGETEAAQTSNTIYLGSRRNSNMFIRIYNKSLEQLDKLGFEPAVGVDVGHWVRCELCARSENAEALVKMIRSVGFACVPEVLRGYLDFKEPNANDSNVSRWASASWWAGFLDNVEKRSLGVAPALPSLEKSAAWVRKQAGVTLALMVEAGGGALDELVSIINEGRKRYKSIHRAMLAAHMSAFGAGGGSSGFWVAPGSSGGVLNV